MVGHRKCLVDLDNLIEKAVNKPIKVCPSVGNEPQLVDNSVCLEVEVEKLLMAEQRERRKRVLAPKYKDYFTGKIISYCPGCNIYVESTDDAIVCTGCSAYWHYDCANVSEKDVVELADKDFYCPRHQLNPSAGVVDLNIDNKSVGKCEENCVDKTVVNSRVSQYVLNKNADRKKKLKNMDRLKDIESKDKGNQFTVHVNTVTYFIMIQTISVLGQKYGIKVKRLDVDLTGNPTRDLFEAIMIVDGVNVPIAITCFHTTCNILLQLMGPRSDGEWFKKVNSLQRFAEVIMVEMIETVENIGEYQNIRSCLISSLSETDDNAAPLSNNLTTMVLAAASAIKKTDSFESEWKPESAGLGKGLSEGHQVDNDLSVQNPDMCQSDSGVLIEEIVVNKCNVSPVNNGVACSSKCEAAQQDQVNKASGAECLKKSECLLAPMAVDTEQNIVSVVSVAASCGEVLASVQHDLVNNKEIEVNCGPKTDPESVLPLTAPVVEPNTEPKDVPSDNQLVVRSNTKNLSQKNLQYAVSVLNRNRNKDEVVVESNLFNIIMKLKSKSIELKDRRYVQDQPSILSEQLNNMTLKLVTKQKEMESMKKKCKDLESLCNEQKSLISQSEKKVKELEKEEKEKDVMLNSIRIESEEMKQKAAAWEEHTCESDKHLNENAKLNKTIVDLEDEIEAKGYLISKLKEENKNMVDRCKSLEQTEAELSSQVKALQEICGLVNEGSTSEVVVVNKKNAKCTDELEAEIEKLNLKVEKLNISESLLKDQLSAKTESLDKIDHFYKEIIDQKDETLNALLTITEENTETGRKMRRLLLRFRSEQELKSIHDLKLELNELPSNEGTEAEAVLHNNTLADQPPNHQCQEPPHTQEAEAEDGSQRNGVADRDQAGPTEITEKKRLCRFGKKCSVIRCEFSHEPISRPCRFGSRCTKGAACLFSHENPLQASDYVQHTSNRHDNKSAAGNSGVADNASGGVCDRNQIYYPPIHGNAVSAQNSSVFVGSGPRLAGHNINNNNGIGSHLNYRNTEYRNNSNAYHGNSQHLDPNRLPFADNSSNHVSGPSKNNDYQLNNKPFTHGNSFSSSGSRWMSQGRFEDVYDAGGQYSGVCNDPLEGGPYSKFLKNHSGAHSAGIQKNHLAQSQILGGGNGPLSGGNVKLCRNGKTCVTVGCSYSHECIQKSCKFGNECPRNDRCLFNHNSMSHLSKNRGGRA